MRIAFYLLMAALLLVGAVLNARHNYGQFSRPWVGAVIWGLAAFVNLVAAVKLLAEAP